MKLIELKSPGKGSRPHEATLYVNPEAVAAILEDPEAPNTGPALLILNGGTKIPLNMSPKEAAAELLGERRLLESWEAYAKGQGEDS